MLLEPPCPGRRVKKATLFHFQAGVILQHVSWVMTGVWYHLLPPRRKLVCSALSAGRPWSTISVL